MSEILLSLNKISLFAFIITLGFLIYEFKLINKEKRTLNKPQIPKFNNTNPVNTTFLNLNTNKNDSSKKTINSSSNKLIFILTFLMLLFFAIFSLYGFFNKNKLTNINDFSNNNQNEDKILVSQGIRIYNDKEVEIVQSQIDQYPVGTNIKIGVESVKEADIDKARIRINEMMWLPNHETQEYDIKNNIYYVNYKIATIPAQLKIEAQLHSLKDGWLGD